MAEENDINFEDSSLDDLINVLTDDELAELLSELEDLAQEEDAVSIKRQKRSDKNSKPDPKLSKDSKDRYKQNKDKYRKAFGKWQRSSRAKSFYRKLGRRNSRTQDQNVEHLITQVLNGKHPKDLIHEISHI